MFVFSQFFLRLQRDSVMGFDTFLAPNMVKPLVDPCKSLLRLQVPKEDVLCNLILRGHTISNTLHCFYTLVMHVIQQRQIR